MHRKASEVGFSGLSVSGKGSQGCSFSQCLPKTFPVSENSIRVAGELSGLDAKLTQGLPSVSGGISWDLVRVSGPGSSILSQRQETRSGIKLNIGEGQGGVRLRCIQAFYFF